MQCLKLDHVATDFKQALKSVYTQENNNNKEVLLLANPNDQQFDKSLLNIIVKNEIDYLNSPAVPTDLIDQVNQMNVGWIATHNHIFKDLTVKEYKEQYGAQLYFNQDVEFQQNNENSLQENGQNLLPMYFPESFDSREEWPECIGASKAQKKCGGCWAFASSKVLADRFCISSKGKIKINLAPQYQISCDNAQKGCFGGIGDTVYDFLEEKGSISEECWPFNASKLWSPKCESFSKCANGEKVSRRYHAVRGATRLLYSIADVKWELMNNGPVYGSMHVKQDFKAYKSGIYVHIGGKQTGAHAITVVGWGQENDTDYWIIANSWGPQWGENGYFKIKMGEVHINDRFISPMPDVERVYRENHQINY